MATWDDLWGLKSASEIEVNRILRNPWQNTLCIEALCLSGQKFFFQRISRHKPDFVVDQKLRKCKLRIGDLAIPTGHSPFFSYGLETAYVR